MDQNEKIQKGFQLMCEGLSEAFKDIANKFSKACKEIVNGLNPTLKRKLTKKKFCKLLQSYGIQRNEIRLIVKNNKRPYTCGYLYKIITDREG